MTADEVDRALTPPVVAECIRRADNGEGTAFYGHVTGSSVRHLLAVLLDLGWKAPE